MRRFIIFGVTVCSMTAFLTAAEVRVDVTVYGATPAGVFAAIAAANDGLDVALIEASDRIGGHLTSGLSQTDAITYEGLSGLFRRFCERVASHYEMHDGPDSANVKAAFRGMHGEPSVNLAQMKAMLAENPNIQIFVQHELASVTHASRSHGRGVSVPPGSTSGTHRLTSPHEFSLMQPMKVI